MESYVYATEGTEYCSKMSSDVTGCDDLGMTFRQRETKVVARTGSGMQRRA
jgi:hypothetical protein